MSDPPLPMRDRVEVLRGFAEDGLERGEHMFYVRIPADIHPLERASRFEDPLNVALTKAGLGEVTGGGSQLGDDGTILYCGVDVFVNNRDGGLELIRSTMRRLGAPAGTVIEEFLPAWRELRL